MKEIRVVVLLSTVFHMRYIHQLLKKKLRKMNQSETNYRMKKMKMMIRAEVFSQTRYFQNMKKPLSEVGQVVKNSRN